MMSVGVRCRAVKPVGLDAAWPACDRLGRAVGRLPGSPPDPQLQEYRRVHRRLPRRPVGHQLLRRRDRAGRRVRGGRPGQGRGRRASPRSSREHRLKPVAVLVTHGHIDHMWCVAPVAGTLRRHRLHPPRRPAPAHRPDGRASRRRPPACCSGGKYEFAEPDDVAEVGDGATLELAGLEFTVDHAPGHTPGSITFRTPYDDAAEPSVSEVMFSGDLLFAGSIGRTDLPGGDHADDAAQPARPRCCTLPDDIVVLPGHGEQTTIGRERATNPFLLELQRGATRPQRPEPRALMADGQAHPAERVPRAAARSSASSSAQVLDDAARAPSSCTASPPSRPAPSSRWTSCCARAADRQGGLRPAPAAGRRRGRADAGLGLHFDLTVPFARYVLENAGKLEFPFRRYQIQKAWRGERPQEGRYREFTQADIDIVGRDALPFHHDVEVARVMAEALTRCRSRRVTLPGQQPQADPGLLPRPRRRRTSTAAIRTSTSSTSCPRDEVRRAAGRRRRARPPSRPSACLALADDPRRRHVVRRRRCARSASSTTLLDEGLDELAAVVEGCADAGTDTVSVVADLRIARGLDYYTGTVFETRMAGYERLGSDLRAAAATTRSPPTAARRTPASASRSASSAHARPAARPTACSTGEPLGARARCSSRCPTRTSRAGLRRRRPAAARPRHPDRGRRRARRSSASRSGTPSGAASRSCGSPATDGRGATRSRTSAPATRSTPTRTPGPHRPRTCAHASSSRPLAPTRRSTS